MRRGICYNKRVKKIISLYCLLIFVISSCIVAKQFKGISTYSLMMRSCEAQYKMNEAEPNTVVIDSSGNDRNGISLRNTSLMSAEGKINKAFNFNGSSDGFAVDTSENPIALTSISVAFWVRTTEETEFDFIYLEESGMGQFFFSVTGGKIQFECGSEDILYSTTDVNDGQWHLVIGTNSDGNCSLYVGNNLEDTGSASFVFGSGIAIQQYGYYVSEYFNGSLDNAMIFSKVLSQNEIDCLYNNGNGRE